MGRDQNDNAIKVQHHGCGIALSAKAGPGKIRKAVLQIQSDRSFKQVAIKFQEEIRNIDRKTSILKEIEDFTGPRKESSIDISTFHSLSRSSA
jgi:UDP:flavonoid glycosyltransferase YjiC (YdhE family)